MKKIGLFWGSTSGNTEIAVEFMEEYLNDEGFEVESHNIADVDDEKSLSGAIEQAIDEGIIEIIEHVDNQFIDLLGKTVSGFY